MARGAHGLTTVSSGPAMPDPDTPLWVGHPRVSLMAVSGVARLQGGCPAAVFYPVWTPHAIRL
jgi:hypothetical protein